MMILSEPPEIPGISGLRRIGGGGFGVVYLGVQVGLDRPAAVKVLHVAKLDKAARRAFEREAKLMAKLSRHPYVPEVYLTDVLPSGHPYLVYEFCPGGALAAGQQLSVGRVIEVGAKIALALTAAHQEGIYHRDVKPGNILVDGNNEPKLSDFGLSLQPAQEQTAGVDALAPAYAPPEVLNASNRASGPADVYSLGATLFALLTGAPPFARRAGEPLLAWMQRVAGEPLPPLPPGVPAAFAICSRRCWPSNRITARPPPRWH
jgi:serine/threonine protein kinase